jgi:ABC-type antimicrobial peptide transport system permease subunit
MSYSDVNYITIRLNPALTTTTALNKIAPVLRKYDPQSPFAPRFLADDYALKFAGEQQVARIASVFAILAVFISCLGLFGLASFMAEQRTKEIGIRKVLGATVTQLITLLSIDFLKLVLLALCLAIPLSAWAMHRWLQDYPYHTALHPWIFAAAASGALLIALITISFQALKFALANPVYSLRSVP